MQSQVHVLCDDFQALDPYRGGMSAEREILAGCRKGKRGKPVSGPAVYIRKRLDLPTVSNVTESLPYASATPLSDTSHNNVATM